MRSKLFVSLLALLAIIPSLAAAQTPMGHWELVPGVDSTAQFFNLYVDRAAVIHATGQRSVASYDHGKTWISGEPVPNGLLAEDGKYYGESSTDHHNADSVLISSGFSVVRRSLPETGFGSLYVSASGKLYVRSGFASFSMSDDGGISWKTIATFHDTGVSAGNSEAEAYGQGIVEKSGVVYAATWSKIHRSVDGGVTWSNIIEPDVGGVLQLLPGRGDDLYAHSSSGGVQWMEASREPTIPWDVVHASAPLIETPSRNFIAYSNEFESGSGFLTYMLRGSIGDNLADTFCFMPANLYLGKCALDSAGNLFGIAGRYSGFAGSNRTERGLWRYVSPAAAVAPSIVSADHCWYDANTLSLHVSSQTNIHSITLYDILGREILTRRYAGSHSVVERLHDVQHGSYMIRIAHDRTANYERIVIP